MNSFEFEETLDGLDLLSIRAITDFMFEHYESIGISDGGEKRIIKNIPSFPTPKFCPKSLNPENQFDYILLDAKGYTFWSQIIYQLAHEMTHCIIHILSNVGTRSTPWIEETICEAMSLYFLDYFATNWSRCSLSNFNAEYGSSIRTYLNNLLLNDGNCRLTQAKDQCELEDINCTAQVTEKRIDRKNEVQNLYSVLKITDVIGLLRYREYMIDGSILLDTERYRNDYFGNKAVAYLCGIQESIINREHYSSSKSAS